MTTSFKDTVKEAEELQSYITTISYELGKVSSDGKSRFLKFNKNASDELYNYTIDNSFMKKCRELYLSMMKKLVRKHEIHDIRKKRRDPLKVSIDHSRLKDPVIMTDQLYNFLNDKSVNLGLANLHLFTNLENLNEISHCNGSRHSDVMAIMENSNVLQEIRESGVDLPGDFALREEDFDLRRVLKPLFEKRLIRRYDIGRLLSIIEHVNSLNCGGRIKTLPEMDKYFGDGTDSALRVQGKEVASNLDVKKLLPLAEKVEQLFERKNSIQKHSKWKTEEEKKKCQEDLNRVSEELKAETEVLRQEIINKLGWAPSTRPSRLVMNLANKNKSLYNLLDEVQTSEGKAKPFLKKDDAKDGKFGYTNGARMKLMSHLSVQPELVKAEDPTLVPKVDSEFEEELENIDRVLKKLMETYRKLSPRN